VQMIFDNYGQHIPGAKGLLRRTSLVFGRRALSLSCAASANGEPALAATLLVDALRMSPYVLTSSVFWNAATRLLTGKIGNRLLTTLRHGTRKA
jgi:hypothetical protein